MTAASCLYHATPLHYLPHVLRDGALYAQSVLAGRGIAPRPTAKRRDRMLGLADYVHLSPRPDTPLLADKISRGYPHALLEFDREGVLALPQVALLPFNTKAWQTRAAFVPVEDVQEQAALWRRHDLGHCPSLEVLVKYGLDLAYLRRVVFVVEPEREMTTSLLAHLRIAAPASLVVEARCFPGWELYRPTTEEALTAYFSHCQASGELLAPPELPFD